MIAKIILKENKEMKNKFHVNNDYVVEICRAEKGKCPFGGYDEHYQTKEKAQKEVDDYLRILYGILPNMKKK